MFLSWTSVWCRLQAAQVAVAGLAAVGPVLDVVGVGAAGLAARVLAAGAVAFADGAAQRGRGLAAAAGCPVGAGGGGDVMNDSAGTDHPDLVEAAS
jgi:hypothetical protein